MAMLSIGNPYVLTVLGTMKEADRELEACLNRRFSSYLIQGEWFTFNSSIRNYIKAHCLAGGAFRNGSYATRKTVS